MKFIYVAMSFLSQGIPRNVTIAQALAAKPSIGGSHEADMFEDTEGKALKIQRGAN